MEKLRDTFGSWGFEDVRTLLATGNVLFEAPQMDPDVLVGRIEEKLEAAFGNKVSVLLRTIEEIQLLADLNPFKDIKVTPQTRLYVTFLGEKPRCGTEAPGKSPEKDFSIVHVSATEVCSVLVLSPNQKTTDLMGNLEKEFGPKVTTRSWNTVTKILRAATQ